MAGLTRSQLLDQMSHTTQEGATAITVSTFIATSDAQDSETARADTTLTGSADQDVINDEIAALYA